MRIQMEVFRAVGGRMGVRGMGARQFAWIHGSARPHNRMPCVSIHKQANRTIMPTSKQHQATYPSHLDIWMCMCLLDKTVNVTDISLQVRTYTSTRLLKYTPNRHRHERERERETHTHTYHAYFTYTLRRLCQHRLTPPRRQRMRCCPCHQPTSDGKSLEQKMSFFMDPRALTSTLMDGAVYVGRH